MTLHLSRVAPGGGWKIKKKKEKAILAHAVPPSLFQSLMFETEIVMYTDIMPKLRRLEPRLNALATYYASLEEGIMMMENLKKMDYDIIGTQR